MTTPRKISEKEIKELYTFTRKHFVEHFDVQMELVDHLACAIEEIWEKNPKTNFNDALKITFKTFGVFGFSDIVEHKANSLSKKNYKKILKYTINRLKWPKILSSITLAIFLFYILKFFNFSRAPIFIMYITGFVIIIIKLYFFRQKWEKKMNGIKLMSVKSSIEAPTSLLFIGYYTFISMFLVNSNNESLPIFSGNTIVIGIYLFALSLFSLTIFDSISSLEDNVKASIDKYLSFSN